MDSKIETNDLSRFKPKEMAAAMEVLKAYAQQGADWLGKDVGLRLNVTNRTVYLVDGRDNTAMLGDDGHLREWHYCFGCGTDGFDGEDHKAKGRRKKKEFEKYDGFCSQECREEFEG